ncbi:MAG TPA: NADH-quinone oxidoreductase subunit C, partial [Gemmata sp.]|nr:NADH-quinone oxidoreductase subunit C [Gemmata sp.]
MTAADVATLLQSEYAAAVTGVAQDGPDLSVGVDPARLVEVCMFLRDDPRLRFEILNDVSGVDYLETDPKKAAKAGFEPHVEVVYHLSSFTFPGRR